MVYRFLTPDQEVLFLQDEVRRVERDHLRAVLNEDQAAAARLQRVLDAMYARLDTPPA